MSQVIVIEIDKIKSLLKEIVVEVLLNSPLIQKHKDKKEFLSEVETAEFLGMSPSSLSTFRCRKKGLPYIKLGGKIFYKYQDIIDYMEANRVKVIS